MSLEHRTDQLCGRVSEFLEGALHAQESVRGSLEYALGVPVPEARNFEAKLRQVLEESKSLRKRSLRVAALVEDQRERMT
jgi:hypothetical protein